MNSDHLNNTEFCAIFDQRTHAEAYDHARHCAKGARNPSFPASLRTFYLAQAISTQQFAAWMSRETRVRLGIE